MKTADEIKDKKIKIQILADRLTSLQELQAINKKCHELGWLD